MASDLIHPNMCGVAEIQMSLQTKSLEVAYERGVGSCMLAVKNEENRRARLQETLIREEVYRLHEELNEANTCKKDLAMALHEAETAQNHNKVVFERMRDALKSKDRKLQQLQTELNAHDEARTEVQRVLTEKMRLEHELAAAKQEAGHFRTLASSFQATMSEKLALERENMTLVVELETEKKATQRALARGKEQAEQCAEYEAQIAQLRRELAKEKRNRENAELEAQRLRDEEDSRQTALEKQVNANKILKEQIKQTEAELQQARAEASAAAATAPAATAAVSAEPEANRVAEGPAKRSRKRKEPEPPAEAVSTPRDQGTMSRLLANRRNPRVSTLPGEKSEFSTTPFIRRTASFALENSAEDVEPAVLGGAPDTDDQPAEDAVQEVGAEPEAEAQAAAPEEAPPKKRTAKRGPRAPKAAAVEGAAAASKVRKPRGKGAKRAAAAAPPLSQVVEEGNEEGHGEVEQPPAAMLLAEKQAGSAVVDDGEQVMPEERAEEQPQAVPAPIPTLPVAAVPIPAFRPAPARKARVKKLANTSGNRTLFDEDEDAAPQAAKSLRTMLGSTNSAPLVGRVASLKRTTAVQELGFSPLKKDRKAAGAG